MATDSGITDDVKLTKMQAEETNETQAKTECMEKSETASEIVAMSRKDETQQITTDVDTVIADPPSTSAGEIFNDSLSISQVPKKEIPHAEVSLHEQNMAANQKKSETEFPSKTNQLEEFEEDLNKKLENSSEAMYMDQEDVSMIKQASDNTRQDYGNLAHDKPDKPLETLPEGETRDKSKENYSSTPGIIISSHTKSEEENMDYKSQEDKNNGRTVHAGPLDEAELFVVSEYAGKETDNEKSKESEEKDIIGGKSESNKQQEGNGMKEDDNHQQQENERISVLEIDSLPVPEKIENKEITSIILSSDEDEILKSTREVDITEKENPKVESNANATTYEDINVLSNVSGSGVRGECPSDNVLNLSADEGYGYAKKVPLEKEHSHPEMDYASDFVAKDRSVNQTNNDHENTQSTLESEILETQTKKSEKSDEILQIIDATESQILEKNGTNQNNGVPSLEQSEIFINQTPKDEENSDRMLADEVPTQQNIEMSEMDPELHKGKQDSETNKATEKSEMIISENKGVPPTIKQDDGMEISDAKKENEVLEQESTNDKHLPIIQKDNAELGKRQRPESTSSNSIKECTKHIHSDTNKERIEDSMDEFKDIQQEVKNKTQLNQDATFELIPETKDPRTVYSSQQTEISYTCNDKLPNETVAGSSDTTDLVDDGLNNKDQKDDGGSQNTMSSDQTQKEGDATDPIDKTHRESHLDKEDQGLTAVIDENLHKSTDGEIIEINSRNGKDASASHESISGTLYNYKSQDIVDAEHEAGIDALNDGSNHIAGLSAHTWEEKEKKDIHGEEEEADRLHAEDEGNNENDQVTQEEEKNLKNFVLDDQNYENVIVSENVAVSGIFPEKEQEDKKVQNSNTVPGEPEDVPIKQDKHSSTENPKNSNLHEEYLDSSSKKIEVAPSIDTVMDEPESRIHKGELIKIDGEIIPGQEETEDKSTEKKAGTESEDHSYKSNTENKVSDGHSLNEAVSEFLPEKDYDDTAFVNVPDEVPDKNENTPLIEKVLQDRNLEDQHGSESEVQTSESGIEQNDDKKDIIQDKEASETCIRKNHEDTEANCIPDAVLKEPENIITAQECLSGDNKLTCCSSNEESSVSFSENFEHTTIEEDKKSVIEKEEASDSCIQKNHKDEKVNDTFDAVPNEPENVTTGHEGSSMENDPWSFNLNEELSESLSGSREHTKATELVSNEVTEKPENNRDKQGDLPEQGEHVKMNDTLLAGKVYNKSEVKYCESESIEGTCKSNLKHEENQASVSQSKEDLDTLLENDHGDNKVEVSSAVPDEIISEQEGSSMKRNPTRFLGEPSSNPTDHTRSAGDSSNAVPEEPENVISRQADVNQTIQEALQEQKLDKDLKENAGSESDDQTCQSNVEHKILRNLISNEETSDSSQDKDCKENKLKKIYEGIPEESEISVKKQENNIEASGETFEEQEGVKKNLETIVSDNEDQKSMSNVEKEVPRILGLTEESKVSHAQNVNISSQVGDLPVTHTLYMKALQEQDQINEATLSPNYEEQVQESNMEGLSMSEVVLEYENISNQAQESPAPDHDVCEKREETLSKDDIPDNVTTQIYNSGPEKNEFSQMLAEEHTKGETKVTSMESISPDLPFREATEPQKTEFESENEVGTEGGDHPSRGDAAIDDNENEPTLISEAHTQETERINEKMECATVDGKNDDGVNGIDIEKENLETDRPGKEYEMHLEEKAFEKIDINENIEEKPEEKKISQQKDIVESNKYQETQYEVPTRADPNNSENIVEKPEEKEISQKKDIVESNKYQETQYDVPTRADPTSKSSNVEEIAKENEVESNAQVDRVDGKLLNDEICLPGPQDNKTEATDMITERDNPCKESLEAEAILLQGDELNRVIDAKDGTGAPEIQPTKKSSLEEDSDDESAVGADRRYKSQEPGKEDRSAKYDKLDAQAEVTEAQTPTEADEKNESIQSGKGFSIPHKTPDVDSHMEQEKVKRMEHLPMLLDTKIQEQTKVNDTSHQLNVEEVKESYNSQITDVQIHGKEGTGESDHDENKKSAAQILDLLRETTFKEFKERKDNTSEESNQQDNVKTAADPTTESSRGTTFEELKEGQECFPLTGTQENISHAKQDSHATTPAANIVLSDEQKLEEVGSIEKIQTPEYKHDDASEMNVRSPRARESIEEPKFEGEANMIVATASFTAPTEKVYDDIQLEETERKETHDKSSAHVDDLMSDKEKLNAENSLQKTKTAEPAGEIDANEPCNEVLDRKGIKPKEPDNSMIVEDTERHDNEIPVKLAEIEKTLDANNEEFKNISNEDDKAKEFPAAQLEQQSASGSEISDEKLGKIISHEKYNIVQPREMCDEDNEKIDEEIKQSDTEALDQNSYAMDSTKMMNHPEVESDGLTEKLGENVNRTKVMVKESNTEAMVQIPHIVDPGKMVKQPEVRDEQESNKNLNASEKEVVSEETDRLERTHDFIVSNGFSEWDITNENVELEGADVIKKIEATYFEDNVPHDQAKESHMEPQENNSDIDSTPEMEESKETINEEPNANLVIVHIKEEPIVTNVTIDSSDKLDRETHSFTEEKTMQHHIEGAMVQQEISASGERVEVESGAVTLMEDKKVEPEANCNVKTERSEEVKDSHDMPLQQNVGRENPTKQVKTSMARNVELSNNMNILTDNREAAVTSLHAISQQEGTKLEETSVSHEITHGVIIPDKRDVQSAISMTDCAEVLTELTKHSGLVIDDEEEVASKKTNSLVSLVSEVGEQKDNEEKKDQACKVVLTQKMDGSAVNPNIDVKNRGTLPVSPSSEVTKGFHETESMTGKIWKCLEIMKPDRPQNEQIVEDLPVSQFLMDRILGVDLIKDTAVLHVKAVVYEDNDTEQNNASIPEKEATPYFISEDELKLENSISNNNTEVPEKTEKDSSLAPKQKTCKVINKVEDGQEDIIEQGKELASHFFRKEADDYANDEESSPSVSEKTKDILNVKDKMEVIRSEHFKVSNPDKEAAPCVIPADEIKILSNISEDNIEACEKTETNSSLELKQEICNVIDEVEDGREDNVTHGKKVGSQFFTKEVGECANNEERSCSISEESKDVLNVKNEMEEVIKSEHFKASLPEKDATPCIIPADDIKVETNISEDNIEALEKTKTNFSMALKQEICNVIDEVEDGQEGIITHGKELGGHFFAKEADEHGKDEEGSHSVSKESEYNSQTDKTKQSTENAGNPEINVAVKELFTTEQASDGNLNDALILTTAPEIQTIQNGNSLNSNLDVEVTTKLSEEDVITQKDAKIFMEMKPVQPNVDISGKKLIEAEGNPIIESDKNQGAHKSTRNEETLQNVPCTQVENSQSSAVEEQKTGYAQGHKSEKKDAKLIENMQASTEKISDVENKISVSDSRDSQPNEIHPPVIQQEYVKSTPAITENLLEKDMIVAKTGKVGSQRDSKLEEKKLAKEKDIKDSEEEKIEDDETESLLMEEIRGPELKQQQKKHHGILSGVGSKVKHSIISKVRKAITCTSVELPK